MPAAPTQTRNVLATSGGIAAIAILLFASQASAGRDRNRVQSVRHVQAGGTTSVTVKGTKTATFSVYKLDRPDRVVVDLANATIDRRMQGAGGGKSVFDLNTWAVSQVSAHRVAGSRRSLVRIVVSLARPGGYKVKAIGNDLVIRVTPRQAMPAPQTKVVVRVTQDPQQARATRRAARQARAAQADARQARAALKAARDASRVASRQADRRVAKALADAKRIKAVLGAARAEAAQTRASLRLAQSDADKAKRDAAVSRRQATQATRAARRAVAAAKADADKAKKISARSMTAAKQQLAVASAKLRRAQTIAKRAEAARSAAQKTRRNAARDAARAQARLASARAAEQRADAQKASAANTAKLAQQYRIAASRMSSRDAKRAEALRQRARDAAADAQRRTSLAKTALKRAESRRKRADAAAKAAEARRLRAVAAITAAETKRDIANRQRQLADSGKARAEDQWKHAELRRKRAVRAAAEATRRARRARVLRKQEEKALRQARHARVAAAANRVAASRATVRLEAAVDAVAKAKSEAIRQRKAAAVAARQLFVLARDRAATQRSIAKARAKTKQLDHRAKAAETRLAGNLKQVARRRAEVRQLSKQRDAAAAELARLKTAAIAARQARVAEQAKLAALSKTRAREEAQLRRVRTARKAAQRKSARLAARPRVRDIDFVDNRDVARVVIALSSPAKPRVIRSRGRRVILEIPNARITPKLERTLDTTRFHGPVRAISSFRDPRNPKNVRVVVELAGNAKGELERVGNTYHWNFRKSVAAPKPTVAARPRTRARPRPRTRSASYPARTVGGYGAVSTPITQQTVAQLGRKRRRVYRGRKIDLDFKDADIHNLLRLLADVGAVNVVIPDNIKAKVTVRLKRVPWDQALEVILASKGLWYRREGNLYRVAPRKELDTEDENEANRIKMLAGSEAPEPEVFTMNYGDALLLRTQLRSLLSPKGDLRMDRRTNSLIINDLRANRRRIISVLRRLDTQTPQIQVEARIVEARSTYVRQIGVQWGGSATASQQTGNATGLIFPNNISVGGSSAEGPVTSASATPSDFAVSLPAAVGAGSGGALGFTLGSVGGNFNLSLRLSALEDQGTVRIISSPKITVISNETATIKQGTSVPISVPAANGTGTQTTFVPADLSLEVTPKVSQRDCSITMELVIKNNEIGPVTAQGESILTKEATTTVLVSDGQTTVVGGVYTRNTALQYSKVPFFGDLPVIGWFFKSRRESDERAELLIFITPRITNKAFLRCE